jgi:hypothetical protein
MGCQSFRTSSQTAFLVFYQGVGGIPISVLHNLTIAYRPERLQKSKLRHPPLRLEIEKLIQRSLVMNWGKRTAAVGF